jgi:hypothetical protein
MTDHNKIGRPGSLKQRTRRLRPFHLTARMRENALAIMANNAAVESGLFGLYRLRTTVKYPSQATPRRSSLSRVQELRARFERGLLKMGWLF